MNCLQRGWSFAFQDQIDKDRQVSKDHGASDINEVRSNRSMGHSETNKKGEELVILHYCFPLQSLPTIASWHGTTWNERMEALTRCRRTTRRSFPSWESNEQPDGPVQSRKCQRCGRRGASETRPCRLGAKMRHDSFVITLPLPAANLRERPQLLAGLCAPLLSGQDKAQNAGQVGLKNKQGSRSGFGSVSLA